MTTPEATAPSRAWLRIFALVYDPFLWLGEIAGLRTRRSALLSSARGRVVEIGAGTGLNAALYPDDAGSPNSCSPSPMRRCGRSSRVGCSGADARRGSSTHRRSAFPFPMRRWTPSCRRSSCAPSPTPNARCARSPAYSAPMGSCSFSNTFARSLGCSRPARTTCSCRGAASQPDAAAIALHEPCAVRRPEHGAIRRPVAVIVAGHRNVSDQSE